MGQVDGTNQHPPTPPHNVNNCISLSTFSPPPVRLVLAAVGSGTCCNQEPLAKDQTTGIEIDSGREYKRCHSLFIIIQQAGHYRGCWSQGVNPPPYPQYPHCLSPNPSLVFTFLFYRGLRNKMNSKFFSPRDTYYIL